MVPFAVSQELEIQEGWWGAALSRGSVLQKCAGMGALALARIRQAMPQLLLPSRGNDLGGSLSSSRWPFSQGPRALWQITGCPLLFGD